MDAIENTLKITAKYMLLFAFATSDAFMILIAILKLRNNSLSSQQFMLFLTVLLIGNLFAGYFFKKAFE